MSTQVQVWLDYAHEQAMLAVVFHPERVLLLMLMISALVALAFMALRPRNTARDRAQARDAAVQAAKRHLVDALQSNQQTKQSTQRQQTTLVAEPHGSTGSAGSIGPTGGPLPAMLDLPEHHPTTGALPHVANPAHPMHKVSEAVRLVPRNAPRVGVRDPARRFEASMLSDASLRASVRSRIASANIEVLRMKAEFFAREAVRAHIHAQAEFVNAQEQQRLSDYYTARANRIEKFAGDEA